MSFFFRLPFVYARVCVCMYHWIYYCVALSDRRVFGHGRRTLPKMMMRESFDPAPNRQKVFIQADKVMGKWRSHKWKEKKWRKNQIKKTPYRTIFREQQQQSRLRIMIFEIRRMWNSRSRWRTHQRKLDYTPLRKEKKNKFLKMLRRRYLHF